MKNKLFAVIKDILEKSLYVMGILLACYGFWGSFFPDLTLVKGTYAIVEEENGQDFSNFYDAEQLYAEILEGKYRVTYRSKLLELIQNRFEREYDERITK